MPEREYPETGWALRHAAREQEEDYAREEQAERERVHAREAMHRRADRGGHDWPCRHGHTFCATSDGARASTS